MRPHISVAIVSVCLQLREFSVKYYRYHHNHLKVSIISKEERQHLQLWIQVQPLDRCHNIRNVRTWPSFQLTFSVASFDDRQQSVTFHT